MREGGGSRIISSAQAGRRGVARICAKPKAVSARLGREERRMDPVIRANNLEQPGCSFSHRYYDWSSRRGGFPYVNTTSAPSARGSCEAARREGMVESSYRLSACGSQGVATDVRAALAGALHEDRYMVRGLAAVQRAPPPPRIRRSGRPEMVTSAAPRACRSREQ